MLTDGHSEIVEVRGSLTAAHGSSGSPNHRQQTTAVTIINNNLLPGNTRYRYENSQLLLENIENIVG